MWRGRGAALTYHPQASIGVRAFIGVLDRLLGSQQAPELGMPVGAGPINGPTPMRDYFRGTSLPLMRGGHSVVLDDEKRIPSLESADFRSAGAVLEH